MRKKGFTLVELLVVITIIAILGGIVISVAGSMTEKARISGTTGTIRALIAACGSYKALYYSYPDLDNMTDSSSDSCRESYADFEHNIGRDNPIKSSGTYSNSNFNEYNVRLHFTLEVQYFYLDEVEKGIMLDTNPPKNEEGLYVDAWNQPINVCPGRNHSGDTPPGPNNYSSTAKFDYPLDIYSIANNGVDDSGVNYDSTAFNTKEGDDIVSWRR